MPTLSAISNDQTYFEHLCSCHINFNLDSLPSELINLFRLVFLPSHSVEIIFHYSLELLPYVMFLLFCIFIVTTCEHILLSQKGNAINFDFDFDFAGLECTRVVWVGRSVFLQKYT